MRYVSVPVGVCVAFLALPAIGNDSASATGPAWTYDRYIDLAAETRRNMDMSQKEFDAVQSRKPDAIQQTRRFLEDRFGAADEAVLAAFARVPREFFHYNYEAGKSTATDAYERFGTPWPIGYGATISEYKLQCYMTQLGRPRRTDTVLEIGTGSGFQAALFAELVKDVYTIEIVAPLGNVVKDVLAKAGYANVHVRIGDGFYGWPEVEGGFDIIMVTCAARYVPPALLQQLKVGGRLVIPVGPPGRGGQVLYLYEKDAQGKVRSTRDLGVIFVPMTGAIEK
ncbi:MAG: protein-L-isoaspartate O-methyltransferase [Candidatus Hydrogenedentes bacterium]|nr:protein-L-isoaspartate O-methyltransferase [Candidatus Hydrogenedentota bacterium]